LAQNRFRFSLQHKVVLAVVFCVLAPVLVMGAYLFNRSEEVLREKSRETLSNSIFRKTTQVEDWMAERLREATRWSSSFIVFEGVEALRAGGEQQRARSDLREYLETIIKHYGVYESLMVLDLDGNVLSATSEEELEPWAREMLRTQMGSSGALVTPIRKSGRLNRPTLLVFHVIQGRGDRPVGYLGQRLDLRELENALKPPSSPADATGFWLLDADGGVVIQYGRLLDTPGRERFPAPITQSMGEGTLHGVGDALWGIRRLEGPLTGHVAASVPAAVAYQPLVDSRLRLIKAGVPVIAFVCALAFVLGRRMVRPILALSHGAQRVAAGDLQVQLPVRGHDELRDLTQAFNEMVREISEGHKSLEEARTREAETMAELRSEKAKFEALAKTDGLTGLYNRRHFQEELEKELERADREIWPLSLLFIDLDHFKQYNDRWGHLEGDAELRRVAAQVLKSIRSTDTAYRYGGEELAVLLPSCPKEQAVRVAEKLRQAVSAGTQKPGRFGGHTTVSIGVATFPDDGRVARGLVDTADAALYEAKAHGRDCVVAAGARQQPERGVGGSGA
jgi:diguanylate cyclase (GGDEF)-like protein